MPDPRHPCRETRRRGFLPSLLSSPIYSLYNLSTYKYLHHFPPPPCIESLPLLLSTLAPPLTAQRMHLIYYMPQPLSQAKRKWTTCCLPLRLVTARTRVACRCRNTPSALVVPKLPSRGAVMPCLPICSVRAHLPPHTREKIVYLLPCLRLPPHRISCSIRPASTAPSRAPRGRYASALPETPRGLPLCLTQPMRALPPLPLTFRQCVTATASDRPQNSLASALFTSAPLAPA